MKAYKGFDKNMQCRGFQFEEGKTYVEEDAVLCAKGFHACENPLDTFKYYEPGNGSIYREVELEDVTDENGDDSKRVGKKITIGARLSVLDICKLHFQYVKQKTNTKKEMPNRDEKTVAAQDWSSLAAQDCSSLAARDCSSLAAQDCSSLAARNCSSLAAQDWSSLAARNCSSLAARNWSSLAAQDKSSLAAQDWSSLAARDCSSLAAQDCSSLAARDCSSLAAQDCSSLAAQDKSSLAAGKNSVIAAFNSKAKGGKGTLIALATRKFTDEGYVITDFKAGIVDGVEIKENTWYKLENGSFVEVQDDT